MRSGSQDEDAYAREHEMSFGLVGGGPGITRLSLFSLGSGIPIYPARGGRHFIPARKASQSSRKIAITTVSQ
jgi:hypothetical protein